MTNPEQMMKDQGFLNGLVALDGDDIIGFANYFFPYYSWTGKAIQLDDLYVKEAYRGQGIGGRLFDQVMTIGKQAHCNKMKWQVPRWNHKAQEFYKNKGASIDDVEMHGDLILE